jgi:hypothetical protein
MKAIHMNRRISDLDARIAELVSEEEAIKRALDELAPARAKTDEPFQGEDPAGDVLERKREWDRLMAERQRVQLERRRCYEELSDPTRLQKE